MPSIRHRLVEAYIHHFRRTRPAADDNAFAAQILRDRAREKPLPLRKLRARVTVTQDAGFETFTLASPRAPSGQRVVYLHGGAFVSDLTPEHWGLIDDISRTGATVIVPRYPLAPEATWRTSRDALVCLVREQGSATMVGDSAGGGLALAIAQRVIAEGAHLSGLVLLAPWTDLTMNPTYGQVRNDPWLDTEVLAAAARLWSDGDNPADPALSPLHGPMNGLPPTLTITGSRDLLQPSIHELVRRMSASGVEVTEIVETGLIHVYPLLPIPEAKPAHRAIVQFLTTAIR